MATSRSMRHRTRRGEVGATDCLTILVVLLAAIVIAAYASMYFGWLGVLIGLPLGLIAAFAALYGALTVLVFLEGLLRHGIPLMPPCEHGKCRSRLLSDFGDFEPEKINGEWGYFRCRCGELYYRDRKAGRVYKVLPDGARKPYMTWSPLTRWQRDS